MFLDPITTKNLHIRPPIVQDCYDWMWDNNPIVQQYLPEPHITQTLENQKEFYEEIKNEEDGWYWSIIETVNNECIGIISITEISEFHGIGEIGIVLGKPEFYGKGYATETINGVVQFIQNTHKLRRLSAECELNNIPMMKVLEKCGFTQEAILKKSRIKNGKPIDTVRYYMILK
jgi:[ribosomal protein S5]-alanine N-acetyltransferase